MKTKAILTLLCVWLFACVGCGGRHSEEIDEAYQLAGTHPARALDILRHVDRHRLSHGERARYALVYTLAQDKSGLDVDEDSLLREAYDYYRDRPGDSLYAKCQYYMGKYYLLRDSSERAMACFRRSLDMAEKRGDKYTWSLALEKLSRMLYSTDPKEALAYARRSDSVYCSLPGATLVNKVYGKLNVSEALLFADSLHASARECGDAMKLAARSGDSLAISASFQVMSSVMEKLGNYKSSLEFSKKAYDYGRHDDVSKLLNLAWAYMEMDSLRACERVTSGICADNPADLYTKYYLLHVSFMKGHDYEKARQYADSAYHYIETMYGEQLQRQERYYDSLVKAQYERGIEEGHSRLYQWILVIVVFSSIVVTGLVLYSYRQYKRKVRLETAMAERQHIEEMRHKDIQVSIMRGYILKKIDVAQKVRKLKENKDKFMPLSEEDWEEIRQFVDNVEGDFVDRLQRRFPNFTERDIQFMLLVRLDMSSISIAQVYGISEKSIRQKMYVYKIKMGIESSLRDFIRTF